jgi:hypothetical protein
VHLADEENISYFCSIVHRQLMNLSYFTSKPYKTMKFTYFNGAATAAGEISVVMSKDAEQMLRHSAAVAADIQRKGIASVVINCGITERRFNEHFAPLATAGSRNIRPENRKNVPLLRLSTRRGDLIDRVEYIREAIQARKATIVMILGWEWTSSTYRRSQDLLYALRDIAEANNAAVIVYTQRITKAEPGTYDRAGIGKLGMLAVAVSTVDDIEKREEMKAAVDETELSDEDERKAREGVTLLINKINNLQGENAAVPAITSSFTPPDDGGEDAAVLQTA